MKNFLALVMLISCTPAFSMQTDQEIVPELKRPLKKDEMFIRAPKYINNSSYFVGGLRIIIEGRDVHAATANAYALSAITNSNILLTTIGDNSHAIDIEQTSMDIREKLYHVLSVDNGKPSFIAHKEYYDKDSEQLLKELKNEFAPESTKNENTNNNNNNQSDDEETNDDNTTSPLKE